MSAPGCTGKIGYVSEAEAARRRAESDKARNANFSNTSLKDAEAARCRAYPEDCR